MTAPCARTESSAEEKVPAAIRSLGWAAPGAGLHENGAASCSGRHRSADVSRTTRDREPPRIPPHPREPPPLTAARSPWRTRYVCLSAPSRPPTVKIVELPGFAEEKVDGDPPEFPLNPDLPRSFRNLVHFPFHPHHLLPLNQVTRRSSWLIRASRLKGGTGVHRRPFPGPLSRRGPRVPRCRPFWIAGRKDLWEDPGLWELLVHGNPPDPPVGPDPPGKSGNLARIPPRSHH